MSAGGERPRPDTSPLAEIGPRIVAHLNEKHAAREKALRASRALIQASARSIREAHRGELAEADGQIARLERQLANERFLERAPEAVVQGERDRLAQAQTRAEGLRERIAALGS